MERTICITNWQERIYSIGEKNTKRDNPQVVRIISLSKREKIISY